MHLALPTSVLLILHLAGFTNLSVLNRMDQNAHEAGLSSPQSIPPFRPGRDRRVKQLCLMLYTLYLVTRSGY